MVVIVVPEWRGPPGVRIFVAARLPWGDCVRGESVEFRPSDPAVQMDDAGRAEVVGVGHNRGSATTGSDCRAGETPVVRPDSRSRPRDYLNPCFALNHLVVFGRGVGSDRIWNRRDGEGNSEFTGFRPCVLMCYRLHSLGEQRRRSPSEELAAINT